MATLFEVESSPGSADAEAIPFADGPGYLVTHAYKVFSASLGVELARCGVALNHFYYLRNLFEEDGLTPAVLSARTRMDRATVTAVLDTMERQDLVRRARHLVDRRKIQVFLTPKGAALREPVLACIARVQDRALAGIPAAELHRFRSTLRALVTNLGEAHAVS